MEFHEAANLLFDLRRYAPRPGLEPTREFLAHLGNPHEDGGRVYVQVAGSNGKGSTARMVERSLREAGLSVGLYTSPHLDDVRERITVDGRPISERAVAEFADAVEPYLVEKGADGASPTFFETLTVLALREFDRQDVDVAVLEVGIGGTHDATSVVDPVASAVTSVTLEHTEFLGDTPAEIARDKAAVAPETRPLVTATEGEALAAIREAVGDVVTVGVVGDGTGSGNAHGDGDRGRDRDRDGDGDGSGGTADGVDGAPDVAVEYGGREGLEGVVDLAGPDWRVSTRLPLLGAHQAANAGVAATLVRQVADELGVDPAADELARGLRNAHWPGRFEVMGRDPLVVLDGAHNPGGCERLVETLSTFDYADCHLVVAAMTDKDLRGMAAALDGADPATVTATCPAVDRAEEAPVLARAFERETGATVRTRGDVAGALADAIDRANGDGAVVVAGSLYAVGEARTRWSRTTIPKTVGSRADAEAVLSGAGVGDGDAAGTVHRVVKTRVYARQARRLRERMLAAGGECAVSALARQDSERVDVVLSGTLAQFDRLARSLDDDATGLGPTADGFREGIADRTAPAVDRSRGTDRPGVDTAAASGDRSATGTDEYPWTDGEGTAVMGILNITPDSFHDGGEYNAVEAARERAERMVAAGVDILDVGGESTRPGADPVPVDEEIDRVVPVVEAIDGLNAMVSIDTRKAAVARAAIEAGADILNDVSGLEDPEMRLVAAEHDVPVVVMHSIETPVDPTTEVHYDDVVEDVVDYLTERVLLAEKAGLDRSQILVDPGIGFGKSARESFELLGRLGEIRALGCPVLVGHSHKSMFELVGSGAGDAPDATVAATAIAAERGADVIRVHDAAENVTAVRVARAAADPESFDSE